MGRKKQAKKADRAAEAGVLPKRVAGMKVPKEVRRAGDRMLAAVASPAGREAIAHGLKIAVTLATVAAAGRKAAEPGATADPSPAPLPAHKPEEIGAALGIMAQEMLGRVFGNKA